MGTVSLDWVEIFLDRSQTAGAPHKPSQWWKDSLDIIPILSGTDQCSKTPLYPRPHRPALAMTPVLPTGNPFAPCPNSLDNVLNSVTYPLLALSIHGSVNVRGPSGRCCTVFAGLWYAPAARSYGTRAFRVGSKHSACLWDGTSTLTIQRGIYQSG